MIYCIWYPSGGFGHFINAILTLHGDGFDRPKIKLAFSEKGASHQLDLVTPSYSKNSKNWHHQFEENKNYSVLIDNGIDDESDEFRSIFPNAHILKVCYSDTTWPIIAHTMIVKAMRGSIKQHIGGDLLDWGGCTDDWVLREKYFLFLRDSQLRHAWRHSNATMCLNVEDMLDYNKFHEVLDHVGITIEDFSNEWNRWYKANLEYIQPVIRSQQVIQSIRHDQTQDLSDITDLWTQAVLYYFIFIEFGVEIPHYDFQEFFRTSKQIKELLV